MDTEQSLKATGIPQSAQYDQTVQSWDRQVYRYWDD